MKGDRPVIFTSKFSHAFFYFVLFFIFFLPLYNFKFKTVIIENALSSNQWQSYNLLYRELYIQTEPIDVLIMGPSFVWTAFKPKIIKEMLEKKLNRKVNVILLGFNGEGDDKIFFQLKEILQKRKIRVLITTLMNNDYKRNCPHSQTYRTFLLKQNFDTIKVMPFKDKIFFYGQAMLGAGRHLAFERIKNREKVLDLNNYSVSNHELEVGHPMPQIEQVPPICSLLPKHLGSDCLIEEPQGAQNGVKLLNHLNSFQFFFHSQIHSLSKEYGFNILYTYIPFLTDESETVCIRKDILSFLENDNVWLMALNKADIFKKVRPDEINKFYSDYAHFSDAGSELFTTIFMSKFVEFYQTMEEEHKQGKGALN